MTRKTQSPAARTKTSLPLCRRYRCWHQCSSLEIRGLLSSKEIDLLHSRLATLSNLRLSRFSKSLKKLGLRANFLTSLDQDFQSMTLLEELDLYDNKIKDGALDGKIDGLPLRYVRQACEEKKASQCLSVLDLSFNLLRSVPEVVATLKNLETIYFVQNRITKIPPLQWPVGLRSLELGANRIRVSLLLGVVLTGPNPRQTIENLTPLVNLEELWLGKNKITKLQVHDASHPTNFL